MKNPSAKKKSSAHTNYSSRERSESRSHLKNYDYHSSKGKFSVEVSTSNNKTQSTQQPTPRIKIDSSFLKIGQAAQALGVSIDTLRRWERTGKITATRTPGGTRLYSVSTLKEVNPAADVYPIETYQSKSLSTEELLRRISDSVSSPVALERSDRVSPQDSISPSGFQNDKEENQNDKRKFLIGSAGLLALTLLLASWIATSYLLKSYKPGLSKPSNVLAAVAGPRFLEVNADTQINGSLFVRDNINGLSLVATPSANTFVLTSGNTALTVTKSAKIDQDISTAG